MTPAEARECMLVALAAAGVNGLSLTDELCRWSVKEGDAIWASLKGLAADGIAQQIGPGMWRLSDVELARRIIAALRGKGCAPGSTHLEVARIDAVAGILKGLS